MRTHFVNFAAFTVSMTLNLAHRSSEVIDFCINRKRVYNFLLDLNSNLAPSLPRFRDIRVFVCRKPLFRFSIPLFYFGQNFGVFKVPLE